MGSGGAVGAGLAWLRQSAAINVEAAMPIPQRSVRLGTIVRRRTIFRWAALPERGNDRRGWSCGTRGLNQSLVAEATLLKSAEESTRMRKGLNNRSSAG